MATAVTMPRLGLTMTEGTVTEWKFRPGEAIDKGRILLIIESEKAEVEIEAFSSGILAATYVEEGTTVPIGALLAAVIEPGEAFDREAFAREFVPEVEGAPATAQSGSGARPAQSGGQPASRAAASAAGPKAAPAARALAKRLGIELEGVSGTGPGGRITVEDVERASSGEAGSAVEVTGTGPPVLLIAGFAVDQSGWRRQVDGLKSSNAVITYDHRGIGASRPMPDDSLTLAALADDARSVLEKTGNLPAVVVGASMGAAVAIELAIAHPEAVRALVLLTPVVERDARLDAVLRSWLEFDVPESEARIRAMLPWFFGRSFLAEKGKREAAAQALRAMATRTPLRALRGHARALETWLGSRSKELRAIAAATLVVAGSDDLLSPPAQAQAVARDIPGARLEVLDGAGHALMIEQAEAVNQLIAEFSRG